MQPEKLPKNCEMIRQLNRYALIRAVVGWVLAALVIVGALAMSGCAHLDPLGTPAKGEKGQADYNTRGGVICREISGNVGTTGVEAYGQGFRCLDVGEKAVEGCIRYTDGRFNYTSPGCQVGPGQ